MDLDKLYKMQDELDKHILEKHNIKMSKEELLDNTILALLVEVGELANTTRCFKHWSTKGMMEKEIVLDEMADVWHFYLSIGNQLAMKLNKDGYTRIGRVRGFELLDVFIDIYKDIVTLDELSDDVESLEWAYIGLGQRLKELWLGLNFTAKEVEQAYLKKHEENYKRQREGY